MQVLTGLDVDTIGACRKRDEFVWLDLVAPSTAELEAVGVALGWSPLLTEDLEHGGQRPKIEDFADHTLVISYAARRDEESDGLALLEHGVVIHGDYLVTVRPEPASAFDRLRAALADGGGAGMTEASIVHRVLDLVVDTTMAATDAIAADVERLERAIDRDPSDVHLEALRSCRRDLVMLRSATVAQEDALGSLAAAVEAIPGFEVGLRSHFRDITDHAHRVVDRLDVSRELLDAAFDSYRVALAARQGAVIQRLTVLSSIFLPLTFLTGFFGQNFAWMAEAVASREDFLLFGIGGCLATATCFIVAFRRLRWL